MARLSEEAARGNGSLRLAEQSLDAIRGDTRSPLQDPTITEAAQASTAFPAAEDPVLPIAPAPQSMFKTNPIKAIGMLMQSVALGMQGKQFPWQALKDSQREAFEAEVSATVTGAKFAWDVLDRARKQFPEGQESFVRTQLKEMEPLFPGITAKTLSALPDTVPGEYETQLKRMSVVGDRLHAFCKGSTDERGCVEGLLKDQDFMERTVANYDQGEIEGIRSKMGAIENLARSDPEFKEWLRGNVENFTWTHFKRQNDSIREAESASGVDAGTWSFTLEDMEVIGRNMDAFDIVDDRGLAAKTLELEAGQRARQDFPESTETERGEERRVELQEKLRGSGLTDPERDELGLLETRLDPAPSAVRRELDEINTANTSDKPKLQAAFDQAHGPESPAIEKLFTLLDKTTDPDKQRAIWADINAEGGNQRIELLNDLERSQSDLLVAEAGEDTTRATQLADRVKIVKESLAALNAVVGRTPFDPVLVSDKKARQKLALEAKTLAVEQTGSVIELSAILRDVNTSKNLAGIRRTIITNLGGILEQAGPAGEELSRGIARFLDPDGSTPEEVAQFVVQARAVVAQAVAPLTGEESGRITEAEREIARVALSLLSSGASQLQLKNAMEALLSLKIMQRERAFESAEMGREFDLDTDEGIGAQISKLMDMGMDKRTAIRLTSNLRVFRGEMKRFRAESP